jgi:hypothetical protein
MLAWFVATDFYLRLLAERCFLKREIQISARITATLLPSSSTAATTSVHTKEVTEDVTKDIAKILEVIRIESAEAITVAAYACMAKLVIALPLVRIDQHAVSFSTLFELVFRGRIVRVAVWMILHGQLAV